MVKRKRIRSYNQQVMKQLCGEIPQSELWIQEERVVDLSVRTAVILETQNGNVFCGYFDPGVHDLRPARVPCTFDLQHVFVLCRRHCVYLLDKSKPYHDRARRCMKRVLVSTPELQLLARLDGKQYFQEPDRYVEHVTDEVAARVRDIYATVFSDEVGVKDAGGAAAGRQEAREHASDHARGVEPLSGDEQQRAGD